MHKSLSHQYRNEETTKCNENKLQAIFRGQQLGLYVILRYEIHLICHGTGFIKRNIKLLFSFSVIN